MRERRRGGGGERNRNMSGHVNKIKRRMKVKLKEKCRVFIK